MTPAQAYGVFTAERSHLSGAGQTKLDNSVAVLQNTSTSFSKEQAMINLNDIYWDESGIVDKSNFGQAVFCIGFTVNPDAPYPKVRV